MEAEYMAISDCSQQAIWIKTLIKELRIKMRSIPIYGDNQGSIFIASNAVKESHWWVHLVLDLGIHSRSMIYDLLR